MMDNSNMDRHHMATSQEPQEVTNGARGERFRPEAVTGCPLPARRGLITLVSLVK